MGVRSPELVLGLGLYLEPESVLESKSEWRQDCQFADSSDISFLLTAGGDRRVILFLRVSCHSVTHQSEMGASPALK